MVAESDLVVRLGGLAAIMGGLLWGVKALIGTASTSLLWPAKSSDPLFVTAQLLFLAGLVGLYTRYKDSLEGPGEGGVAFTLSSIGGIASCVGQVGLLSTEVAWYVFGLGCVVECIGLVALGAAASHEKTLPYWSSLPFVISLVGSFSFPIGNSPNGVLEIYLAVALRTLFGLGWALVGYHLFFSGSGKE